MRRSPLATALTALALLTLLVFPAAVVAREELDGGDLPAKLVNAQMQREHRSLAARPRVSGTNDTTYVGFVPGKVTATNYWGIGTGNFRPYSSNPADYGYWGFDGAANIAEVHGDSLFGWWPVRYLYTSTGGLTLTDDNRPWWAVDFGNQCNFVINQGAAHKRTFGITGVWHRDNGSVSGGGVSWAPLSGTHSLWCGLRRDGDLAFTDPITNNPYNARTLYNNGRAGGTAGGGIGTNQKFPGYASQWDQMAYRDLDVGSASTITLRFRFRTNMSTGMGTATGTRTGWFDKDPLEVTVAGAAAGNFISSNTAGVNAPIDSFMVYVGSPVEGAWLGSDGSAQTVYDPQRRWFAEVLHANEGLYQEVFTTFSNRAAQQVTTPAATIQSTWGDTVRVVFRTKTNRGFDDEGGSVAGGYSSGGAGAAVIDDVEYSLDGGPFILLGDFEGANDIDNSIGVSALAKWKSTGKPPGIFHHIHSVDDLVYEDLCGPVGGPLRICNLAGNIISAGDHDQSEATAGLVQGTAFREVWDGVSSPTINLRNGGGMNEMGITAAIADATDDIYLEYDVYTGAFDFFTQGNAWYHAFSAWPGKQVDGTLCWSDWRVAGFLLFNPDKQCFQDQEPSTNLALLQWSQTDAEGGAAYPDSIRAYIARVSQCFRFGVTTGCAPSDGIYWDNFSIAFIDGAAPPMTVDIWQWVNDTFTVNGLNRNGVAPGSAAFDTTTALVKSGLNIAQTAGNTTRYAVPGDTTMIVALGANLRLDLVFRVDPGPGNYVTLGTKASGLRAVPTSASGINYTQTGAGQAHERNFWAQYLASNGAKGTPAGHPAGAANGGRTWSSLVWNSARIDTAEVNLYQISARGIGVPAPGAFATMYEESDPKFTKLGVAKNRCFLTTATAAATQANTVCNIALTDGWPTTAGYVAENGLPLGSTYEYTKVFPDGQFTPGTHVEYFLRREDTPIGSGPFLCPDTSTVYPQPSEGSTDAHRWQQFSVLPDTWKKGAYGGLGQACMLYVDLNDRRGDERVWVSVMDSIGGTSAAKRGAHNGWRASGNGANLNDPSSFVYNQNQQPGTIWDMYGVKASESLNSKVATLGVDLSNHASSFQIDNKWSFQGPSLGMLEAYYKVLVVLSGDLSSGVLGPFNDLGNNDVKMLQDFLLGGTPTDVRGLYVSGDGFVESASGIASNASLLNGYLYTSLRDPSYLLLTGNTDGCIDVVMGQPITTNGDIYGIRNGCVLTNDVLQTGTRSVLSSVYEPAGNAVAPLVSGVFHDVDSGSGENWKSVVDGWDIENLQDRMCGQTIGRLAYIYNLTTNIFGSICTIAGSPAFTTDVPQNPNGQAFVDFVNLRNNPLVSGQATIDFGLAKGDRVEVKVFDVSGRLVRVLADREFAPGKYSLTWDGADAEGRQVARGVYFTQVRYVGRGFADARKLTVLR